jgi:hypothetical protein
MLNAQQKQWLDGFQQAKQIALSIPAGHFRLAKHTDGTHSDFYGYKDSNGDMYVMTEEQDKMQNPDATIYIGKYTYYARRVSGEHTVMSR